MLKDVYNYLFLIYLCPLDALGRCRNLRRGPRAAQPCPGAPTQQHLQLTPPKTLWFVCICQKGIYCSNAWLLLPALPAAQLLSWFNDCRLQCWLNSAQQGNGGKPHWDNLRKTRIIKMARRCWLLEAKPILWVCCCTFAWKKNKNWSSCCTRFLSRWAAPSEAVHPSGKQLWCLAQSWFALLLAWA